MLTGSMVAMVTPMGDDGSVDWAALNRLVDHHVEQGTDASVSVGPTGESATRAHNDRIAVIGDLSTAAAAHTIDATDKIVAPGFVDVHNHSDGWLLKTPNFVPKTIQGFTTEVIMADGISYAPVDPSPRAHWIYLSLIHI